MIIVLGMVTINTNCCRLGRSSGGVLAIYGLPNPTLSKHCWAIKTDVEAVK